jgi:hypothetical protein
MRSFRAALAFGGALLALPILFVGVAHATTAAPPPGPSPAPTGPAYICDNIFTVTPDMPGVFGYTNCQAFGGMPASAYFTNSQHYMLIPRKANNLGKIQKFNCYGGNVDIPSAVGPAGCSAAGPAIPASEAPAPVPFAGP